VNKQASSFWRSALPGAAALLLATILAGGNQGNSQKPVASRMGQAVDWTAHYVHYPQGASLRALAISQRDPRAFWNYLNLMNRANQESLLASAERSQPPRRLSRPRAPIVDWSVELGAAGTAVTQYPAKYSFDVNATPDCTKDFVVFAINSAPSATQANIAAFNNLYSGANIGGNPPLCSGGAPGTLWAYRAGTARIATSPVLSLDGTKVAFVDNANPAVFHVLTWSAADGGTVPAPATPTAGEIVNLTLTGATTDPDSSPFVDYYNDFAYVGTNNGRLYKITGVFHGTPALAGAPWPITGLGTALTSPVIDFSTGNIFIGNAAGQLYGFTSAGAAITGSPATIGNGGAHGMLADPVLVDGLNGLLYVATGRNTAAGTAIVAQVSTSNLSSPVVASIGSNNVTTIHAPAFNAPYFSGMSNGSGTAQWFLYVCGLANGPATSPVLYRVGFNGSPGTMKTAVDATTVSLSANNGEQCSPLTEFQNGVDRLFLGLLTSAFVEYFDISTTTTPTLGAQVSEAGGTSGIIVDNVSSAVQASSIYFSTEANSAACRVAGANHRCAVKLTTQGGTLQ